MCDRRNIKYIKKKKMNRNLHSPTKLTEFARDFDIEPDTFFAKFVNKITNVYNSGYNTMNVVPTRTIFQQSQESSLECPTPANSFSGTSKDEKSLTNQSIDGQTNSNGPSTSKFDECNANQIDDYSTTYQPAARTQSSVMRRISNLMIRNNVNNNLSNYKDSELHQFWMPDNKSKECYECSQKFSTFRRKHHCRLCGQIFCSKCCNQVVPGKIINCSGDLKVCTYCSRLVLKYLKSSDINSDLKSDLQALQDDLANKFQLQNEDRQLSVTEATFPQRKISVGYQEERFFSQPKYLLSNADRKNILQQSTSLKILYEDLAKALPSHNHGSDIINYLITKNKSSNTSQAIAILTAMAEAGYITEIEMAGVSPIMVRSTNLFNGETMNSSNPSSDSDYLHEFNENAYYKLLRTNEIMSNSGTFQLNLDVDNSLVHLSKPESNVTGVDGAIQSHGSLMSLSQIKEVDVEASIMSTTGSKALQEAFCKHEDFLLTQLLRNENLDESWSKTLIPICARIVNTLPSEMIGMDQMDIRNYVHFKKVPDGLRHDCAIIRGAVFSKNVVHKDMATVINEARILLLQCPIVYQRNEGKYVSIETLLRQEREHLTNVVGRIRSFNPNVIIVHKNVSGIAQDMLRNLNITLVVDVKLSVLKRLSRCLQCDIVPTIDSNIGRPKLGLCEKFYIKKFTNSLGATKTLMFTETPSNPRGCSVLLRGGDFQELIRVKRVAAFLLFTRYNWRMELSFLLNEFACPPLPKPNIFDSKDYSPCTEINATKHLTNEQNDDDCADIQQGTQLNLEHRSKKCDKRIEKKTDEKIITKKNVQDFSDPLRAKDIMTNSCDLESPVKFAVEQPCDNRFRTALNSTILSISPFSQFPLPFLETEHGKKCSLRSCFPKEIFYSKQWSDNVEKTYERTNSLMTNQNPDEIRSPHEFLQYKVVEPADSRNFQTLLANFRASGGILKKKQKMDVIARMQKQIEPNNATVIPYRDALDINNHQRLPVLFSNFYYNPDGTSSFCVHPNLLNMVFYGDNDIMLGQFLEEYCFSSSYICGFCKLPMLGHVRRYVHSMGSVSVKLNEEGQSHKQISMFSWCLKCQEFSKIAHMQRDTWCLSFGKYLEMRFHSHAYKRRRLETDEYDSTMEIMKTCSHSLHRDHVQYFSYNGIVASFSYTTIDVWDIQLPSLIVLLKPMRAKDPSKYLSEIKAFTSTGHQLYATIYDRLAILLSEVEFPMLIGLKSTLNSDQLAFREKANQVAEILDDQPLNTHTIDDAMFMMKKLLADNFEIWIQRLNDVHQQYRSICAALKQDTIISSPSIITTPTQSLSQSERGAGELQSENQPADSGVICTEDLNSEPGSPIVIDSSNVHPLNFHSKDSESEKSVESPVPTHSSNEPKSITLSDKKSMKNIIRDLLPNDKTAPQMLNSPIPSNEYFTLPIGCVPVLVHDSDYSSVIAFSLASLDYRKKLDSLSYCDVQRKSFDSATEMDDKEIQSTPTSQKDGDKDRKTKSTQTHVEVNFQASSSTTQFTCKIYFARDFDSMRTKLLNVSENGDGNDKNQTYQKSTSVSDEEKMDQIRSYFIRSMSKSARWEARGGKSGSKFCKTLDDRFILKEMTKNDISKFENFAPNYFDYINQCVQQNRLTLLAKIIGVFRINIKKKDNPLIEKSLLIMENLFYDCNIDNKFDLKGSLRNRHVDPNNQNGEETVLLDENLIQLSFLDPLYILTHSKVILREAISRDAIFLEKNDVMDYSLLVGLDKSGRMLVLGIIDYIRTYTLDKKLESLVKTNLMGKQLLPTIVSPKLYRQRFTEAMDRYFLVAPDRWEGLEKQPIV